MTRESENTKYLYGASVQGIQNFIFQTNELKDIIGASGLVEQICKNTFDKELKDNGNLIVQAAGKIKCIYSSKNECENAVKNFPKRVMEMAPGIIITQAVVKFESDFKKADEQLDKYLGIQRNKPAHSLSLGLMGITRSRKTGLPAIKRDGADYIDEPTDKKHTEKEYVKKLCKNCMGKIDYGKIAFDIDMMNDKNNWIAIIHADGNGFGKITQSIGNDAEKLKSFSSELDDITKKAAQEAFEKLDLDKNQIIPFRPIILGGDDLTVICRADLAIKYTQEFMATFETKSATLTGKLKIEGLNKLTTCAGIAFIKSSYPFYYGYNLAEELCGQAKNDA
ncbi:MAG: hypothetical protein LBC47_06195, partial [Tannerella sp.]|nr:hypothetical protein [Tannerella sp.]